MNKAFKKSALTMMLASGFIAGCSPAEQKTEASKAVADATKTKEPIVTNPETKMTKVTRDNFVVAETDMYFTKHSAEHAVNTFRHSREYSTIESQVVIRENQDCLYSHAVVDVSEGVTLTNPDWDRYSIIQVIDENEYTIDVIYPGESKTITKDMLTMGTHVWLNTRTEVLPETEEGYAAAHKHQDSYIIDAKSAKPYQSKGFEKESLDAVRHSLLLESPKILSWKSFGMPEDVDQEMFTIAAAGGWAGLPEEHALYWPKILPQGEALKSTVPSKITLPKPPLQYERGGFMSVTVYDENAWIATENYALRDRNAKRNEDESITFYFNDPEQENNITTVDNWGMVIRFYLPETPEAVIDYINDLEKNNVKIELVEEV